MECIVEAKSCFKSGTSTLELTPGGKKKKNVSSLANACLRSRSPTNRPRSGTSWTASHGKCDPRGQPNVKPEPGADAGGPRVCVCGGYRHPQPWPPALDPEGLLLSLGLGSSPGPRRPALCRVPAAAAHHWMMPRCRPRLPAGEAGTASAMAPAGCSRAASGRAAPVPSALFTLELGRARGNHAGSPAAAREEDAGPTPCT